MATTNFAAMTDEQLTIWARETWSAARNYAFTSRFTGSNENSMIQRLTDLRKTRKGARAVMTLVADLVGDGVAGDNTLEGNEEAMAAYDEVINIDQLRHANKHEGKMADQRSVVTFRQESRNKLAYWLSDRMDQLSFLTLSGVAYSFTNKGVARVGSALPALAFAGDVTAPSTNRHFQWDATNGLSAGDTAAVAATDLITWDMFLDVKTKLTDGLVKPIRGGQGMEVYNVFLSPQQMRDLKKDTTFQTVLRDALPRSSRNPVFVGSPEYFIDGFAIYSFRHVYRSAVWGAGANVEGARALFCGAQSMGMADIGTATWVEKMFDFDNQPGIAYGKMFGLKKPVFRSPVTATDEDFGVIAVDTAAAD